MSTYHIATQQRRIITVVGPPDNPVATTSAQLGTGGDFYNVVSVDGTDIWVGGQGTLAPLRDTGLWRSQDEGSSWADASADLPDGHDQDMNALFALAPDLIYGGGRRTDDTPDYRAAEWDGAIWSHIGTPVVNRRTGHIWASGPGDVYATCYNGLGGLYWYDGAIWQEDVSIAPGRQVHAIFGINPNEIYIHKKLPPAGIYKGFFNNWLLDLPTPLERWALEGNGLWCSPGGDVYFFGGDWGQEIWKKPAGGIWALHYICPNPVTTAGGIYGFGDTDIIAVTSGWIYRGDGTNWWPYALVADLGLPPASFGSLRGVWGGDYLGPLVIPTSPIAGEVEVAVGTNITLTLQDDDSVVVNSILVEIDQGPGWEVAFDYDGIPQFKPGWDGPGSSIGEAGGVYTIVIDPTNNFNVGTTVSLRVTAIDPSGNPERLV